MNNHLGNVMATISDKHVQVAASGNTTVDYYTAELVTATDYCPFGMQMPQRQYYIDTTTYIVGTTTTTTSENNTTVVELYKHSFNDTPSVHPYVTVPTSLNSNLSGSTWTNSRNMWTNYASNTSMGKAIAFDNSTADTATVTLTLNIASNKKVGIKSFSFYNRVSNSGYRHWKMYINGIEVGDSSLYYPATGSTGNNTVKSTGTVPVKNVVEDLTGSITVLLKLYDHDAAYPNGNAQGTFRMDDFVLNGYINDDGGISGSGYQYANKGGYRYGFNGQEKSDEIKGEGNSYTAEFWEYDPRLGRRWNVDPKPTSGISEYSAFQNNPIYGIDVLGDTTYRFNKKDGSYIGMFDLNVGGQIGSYGSMKTIEKGKNKQEVWEGTNFEFADPANDSKDIRDGVINKLVFVSNEEIKALLTEKGAFNYADKNNPWRFYQNSKGGQNFDYSYSIIPDKYSAQEVSDQPLKRPSPLLFLPEGDYTAHNHMNFGNYLWGASGYTLGFNFATLQIGAHINSVKNPGTNGYPRQWDSPDDQNSIKKGAFHALQFKYRTILEVRHQAQIQQQGGYRK